MRNKYVAFLTVLSRKFLLRDAPLMVKLTVYSTMLVVIPTFMIGIISYRESSSTLEKEARIYSWQLIEQVTMYVEDYFRGFEISTLKIVNHPDTAAFLKLKSQQEITEANIVPDVRAVLKNSAYSQSDILNITLILDGIQTINSTISDGVSSVEGIEQEHWYDTIPVMGRPKVYSRMIKWNGRTEPVFSVVKPIANPLTLQRFGMLVIDLNYKRLHDVAHKIRLGQSGQGYLFILDEQGYFVYHPRRELIGRQADPEVFFQLREERSGSITAELDGVKSLLTYSRSDTLHWQVVTAIPYEALVYNSRQSIARMIFGTTAFCILLAMGLSISLSASLVKPIRRMYQHMRRVESGQFNQKLPVETKDEIGKLSAGFNIMVDRLAQLLEEIYYSKLRETEIHLRQKETELKMLQAQINPHFLYNSLDTIRGMALEHEMEEISSMAAALARLLRYNVKESSSSVTVQQEMEIVKVYLRIQQYRFEDRLDYEIDIPDWVLQKPICKFTLQPLVENCIIHALERSGGRTCIRISVQKIDEDKYALVIADNGPGITQEQLVCIRARLEVGHLDGLAHTESNSSAGAGSGAGERGGSHIGLRNVHLRIRHMFGEPCGVKIDSIEGTGTEVSVVLPCDW